MDLRIRPITDDELEAYCVALEVAFSGRLEEGDLDRERLIAIPERYLGAFEGDRIVGGAASLPIDMTLPGGRPATCAFVTQVGVTPTHRRRGINTALMRRQLDNLHERGEPFAALWASEGGIYGRYGYGVGSLFATLSIDARRSRYVRGYEPSGSIDLLERDEALPLMRDVYERVRRTRPGMLALTGSWPAWHWFQRAKDKDPPSFHAIHRDVDGAADGFVVYRAKHDWPDSVAAVQVEVTELITDGPGAYADLWRFVLDVDLVTKVEARNRPVDEPLMWLFAEPRQLRMRLGDALWVRLVDVPAALELRSYVGTGSLTIDVRDRFCPWNDGRVQLTVREDETVRCVSTDASPDLRCSVNDLGSVFLDGTTFNGLWAAGQVLECTEGALRRADALFGSWTPPWSSFIL